jgi:MFS family permease
MSLADPAAGRGPGDERTAGDGSAAPAAAEPVVPAAAAARPAAARRLFNRDFVLLWQGQFVSQLGSQAFAVATMYWAMQATGSASLVGTLLMLSLLPGVVLSPLGGAFADRHSRRAIIIVADVLSGLAVLALAALFYGRPDDVRLLVAALLTVGVALGIVQSFFRPAIAAAIPDLVPVERLATANSLHQTTSQLSLIAGQGVGGVLYALVGAPALLLIDGLSYLFSAGSETFIRIPQARPAAAAGAAGAFAGYRRDLAEGLRFVRAQRGMLPFLVTVAALNFLLMPVIVMLPFYVDLVLGRGAEWYGFLLAGLGVGALAGSVLAGALPLDGRRRAVTLIALLVATGACFAGLGQVTSPPLALGVLGLIGLLTGLFNVQVYTIFQLAAPGELRGRIMGLLVTLAAAAAPLGLGLGGVLGDLTGKNVPLLFAACGALTAIVVVGLGGRPAVLDFLGSAGRSAGTADAA